jgi:hypothetical protein
LDVVQEAVLVKQADEDKKVRKLAPVAEFA